MGRYCRAYYTNNKNKLDQTELDNEVYEMEMDESLRQRLQLGRFNDYQGTCDDLISNISELLACATDAHDFEVLFVLCHIVKDCKECDCMYVSVYNF